MYPVAFLFIAQLVLLLLSVVDASSGMPQNSIDIDPTSLALLATAVLLAYSLWPTSRLVNDWLVPLGFLALGLIFLEVTGSSEGMLFVLWTLFLYLVFLLFMHFTVFAHRAILTSAFFILFFLWFASHL